MTTNKEHAAEILSEYDLEPQQSDFAAHALDEAGLLMPDLNGPDNDPTPHYLDGVIVARFGDVEACVSIEEYDNQKVVPDGKQVSIAATHRAGNRVAHKTYGEYSGDPSLEDARKEALDMLAALDWIEKNK